MASWDYLPPWGQVPHKIWARSVQPFFGIDRQTCMQSIDGVTDGHIHLGLPIFNPQTRPRKIGCWERIQTGFIY